MMKPTVSPTREGELSKTTITVSTLAGFPVFSVSGPLAGDKNWGLLDDLVEEKIDSGAALVLFNLADCHDVDPSALHPFLTAVRKLRHTGWVGIVGADLPAIGLFEAIFCDDPTIQFFPTLQNAFVEIFNFLCQEPAPGKLLTFPTPREGSGTSPSATTWGKQDPD